jgi:NitT/TauT family transport system ATP-binding protein
MAWIDIERLSFAYPGQAPVVDGVSWQMAQGAFHCLLGRSGCGKTSLLQLVAGLLQPQAGRIVRAGGSLAAPGPQLGVMFQDRHAAEQLLAQLGLAALARQQPGQLSGGQQSRVALARALMREPALLLLDEPFAALDAITRAELQDELLRSCRARGTTVLFVTHDINEAVYLGDRVALMHGGRLVADIAIDLPAPRTQAMRHGPAFNAYAAQVRAAMDGASA